jgi:hypothetical protein
MIVQLSVHEGYQVQPSLQMLRVSGLSSPFEQCRNDA